MKVLEEKVWNIQHRCTGAGNGGKGCNSLLEIERDDLRYYHGVPGDSWGSRDPEVMFKCPVCNQCTDLKLEYYPHNHRDLQEAHIDWIKNNED